MISWFPVSHPLIRFIFHYWIIDFHNTHIIRSSKVCNLPLPHLRSRCQSDWYFYLMFNIFGEWTSEKCYNNKGKKPDFWFTSTNLVEIYQIWWKFKQMWWIFKQIWWKFKQIWWIIKQIRWKFKQIWWIDKYG